MSAVAAAAAGSSNPGPPTAPAVYSVDAAGCDREIWLVKVPEVVAAAVRSGTFEGRRFGVVTSERTAAADVATNSAAGRKRPLVHMHCTLDSERLVDAFGADAQKRIPSSYSLTLDAPNGARILTFSESGGFVFAGVVVQSGNMVPDSADPAYSAYVTQRRQRDLTAQSSKKGTVLARDADASRLGAIPIAASKFAAPASGRSAALPAVPRVATIYALFEHGAYWTLQDMSRATAKRENDIKPELAKACDYIRSGPHKGSYRLKPAFASLRSVKPEPNDGIV